MSWYVLAQEYTDLCTNLWEELSEKGSINVGTVHLAGIRRTKPAKWSFSAAHRATP